MGGVNGWRFLSLKFALEFGNNLYTCSGNVIWRGFYFAIPQKVLQKILEPVRMKPLSGFWKDIGIALFGAG
jgi:hypothetical protein